MLGALTAALLATLGALPGRVDSADLIRLRAYGQGRVEAGAASLDAATGWKLAYGFGAVGCVDGRAVRAIVHPQASLDLLWPAGSSRVDLTLRALGARRSLRVFLDEQEVGGGPLAPGWQRVSVPLALARDPGKHRLKLQLSPHGEPLDAPDPEAGRWPPDTLGVLEAIVPIGAAQAPETTPQAEPIADSRTFWLEAGESACLPLRIEAGQALEAEGTARRGTGAETLDLVVERVTAYGVRTEIAAFPSTLDIPWNLHLADSYDVSPSWLCLTARGAHGAAGLRAPRLTLPATASAPPAAPPGVGARDVVLLALRGLGDADARAVRSRLAGLEPQGELWTTATAPRQAIASLLTGRYPLALDLRGLSDQLPAGTVTLADAAAKAGRRTLLRAGWVPLGADSPVYAGFGDRQIAAPNGFKPHAAEVLDALLGALARARGPALAVGILGDPAPPYAPRADAWQHHDPPKGRTPWPPLETAQVMREVAEGTRKLDARGRQYLQALRRGKIEETLEAVEGFLANLGRLQRPAPPLVVVVGLGGEPALPGEDPLAPGQARVPLWWLDAAPPAGLRHALGDLTDLTATLAAVLGIDTGGLQGTDLRLAVEHGSPPAVFVTDAGLRELVVSDRTKLVVSRQQGTVELARWSTAGWQPEPYREIAEALAGALERRLDGWLGAGPRWSGASHDPPAPGLPPGHEAACGR